MKVSEPLAREVGLAAKFGAVSVVGFLADAAILRLGMAAGLGLSLARLISLALAFQITFGLSRRLVFSHPEHGGLAGQWWRYMIANSFGGLCSFAAFVGLTAMKWPFVLGPWIALVLSAGAAFVINYAGARLFVFGRELASPRQAVAAASDP
jgi:putative flippase GtrA